MELGFLIGSIVKIAAIIAYFYGVLWVMSLPSRWLKIGGMVVAFGVIQLGLTRFGNFQLLNDFDSGLLFQACAMAMVALGLNLIYGFNGQFSLGQWGFYGIGAYTSADITYRWVNGDARGLIVVGVGTIVGAIILTSIGRLVKKIRGIPVLSAFTLYLIGTLAAGFIAVMAGKLLHPVFQPLLGTNLDPGVLAQGIPMQIMFFLAVIFAGIFAAEVSFLFGLPVLTLGSDYFGIATLGFTIVVNVLMINSDTVLPFPEMKGGRGMVGIPKLTTWFWAILSVREDETAAKAMGIDIAGSKLMAFVIGSLFAGMGGAIYAHFIGFLSPGSFNFLVSFNPLIIVVFGGLGSMTGTIVSSFGWLFFLEGMLRVLLGQMGTEAPTWRYVLYPITLLLMMLIRPQGLLGTVEWGFLKAKVVSNRQKHVPTPADTPAVEA